ncbi:MAG: ABC transporter ATP-binding protein [Acetatifactor sp.]
MIEVTNLTKRYGSHVAVDHLSFRVEKGQIYGFLGPNGAGKSTTMNIITGYLAASEGKVTIDGKDIQKEPEEAKKKIGYLPELPPLYMEMTVEEYLSFVAELKKLPRAERKEQIAQVMEMTQITDMKGRLIRNLSKGYRQRVGLAQAILGDPEVIILDEPSVGLDPKQIIEIRDLIRKLGENHTIILSSHILSEVSAVCDHIMIIAHGQLVASDSPEGLQKLMTGSMELQLTVRGEYEALQSVLESLPNVDTVEKLEEQKEDCVKVKVISKDNADIREEIFFALAEAKLPIMELRPEQKSLEDIFLELTEDVEPVEKQKSRRFGSRREKNVTEEEAE